MRDPRRIEDSLLRWRVEPTTGELVDGPRRLGWDEVARWARRVADELARDGVRPGDRVAIHLEHEAEAVAAIEGAWIAGAIAVPVNAALKSPQVAHILRDSGSRLLLASPALLARLDAGAIGKIPVRSVPGPGAARDPRADLEGGDAPAAILYTSGSTGRPKGILVSHANLLAGARIVSGYLDLRPGDRILSVLPFSFDYGLNQLLTAVRIGATLVLQRSRLPADVVATLRQERITVLAGVPPFWVQLMRAAGRRLDLPDLRLVTNSGGVFPVDLVRRYREQLPHVRIHLMYGLTEAFRSTHLPPEEVDRRPDSIGRAIPECEVLVLDERGEPCSPGQPGELVHRGPTVALGYWNDPEATARVFVPDPLDPSRRIVRSGDVVLADAEGWLRFVGRRDQLIKSYGYRVSPDEVEELLRDSGLVAEVAVHGRPDEVAGSVIVAHIVPARPGDFSVSALLDSCRDRMPAHMIPRSVEVHGELPRTASGKIDRRALAS